MKLGKYPAMPAGACRMKSCGRTEMFPIRKRVIMNRKRIAASGAALLLCLSLFAGCGTSHRSQLESSEEEPESFASEYSAVIPSDNQAVVMPELERPEQLVGEREVTDLYKSSFLGLWDTDDGAKIFEFKSNENLVVWKADGSAWENFTYWFQEDDGQPRLYVFRNGDTEATAYSFTCGPDSISLFSPDSGDVQYRLNRRTDAVPGQGTNESEEPQATPAPAATQTPAATPTATPTVQPSEPAASAEPSTEPSSEPSPSPEPSTEPSPSASPEPELSETVKKAMPAIECVMDVVLSGHGFDPQNEDSYWGVMVRYLSRTNRADEADGCFTVSREDLENASREVFADFNEVPQCPADSPLVTEEPTETDAVSYRILWGEPADCEMTVLSCEGNTLRVSVGGAVYQIVVNGSGAIVSVAAE